MHEFLTVKEAATLLRLHPTTVHRHLNAGILPGNRIGQKWRIRRTDLDEQLRSSTARDRAA
jgi:excisionase family DNA binding protein